MSILSQDFSVTYFEILDVDGDYIYYEFCVGKSNQPTRISTKFLCPSLLKVTWIERSENPVLLIDLMSKLKCSDELAKLAMEPGMHAEKYDNYLKLIKI